jgi:hypothetical protein
VFCRTGLGDTEIRLRDLGLSRSEQLVLVAVDQEIAYATLAKAFEQDDALDLDSVLVTLLGRGLINEVVETVRVGTSNVKSNPGANKLDPDEFYSSSLDPLHSGSGLMVDTRNNFVRSVQKHPYKQASMDDVDIPLSLELDTKLRIKKEKRKSKLVQVFPEPPKPKKRRRSKRAKVVPVSKWPMRIYAGLTILGVILLVFALFAGA